MTQVTQTCYPFAEEDIFGKAGELEPLTWELGSGAGGGSSAFAS